MMLSSIFSDFNDKPVGLFSQQVGEIREFFFPSSYLACTVHPLERILIQVGKLCTILFFLGCGGVNHW